ncbi:hypothetical protein T310_3357 [Rasamsonia emersonii CBS 393.64]|uniref:Uncharacterized protein n=1 Tax=Rasamsonia emersonii (strain ATCC 16479 / CBS 393.64 / IMI 116815) TaxID=1408163 RepID=A0A0F4YX09_RASE3|nr:hypothetical protein T310_3357 [Rasamsonia emersonii CBS 393.64]KKA22620.1 hypothetical protein T310_3357 [Rasamsonia emersonii CBS 393.64]
MRLCDEDKCGSQEAYRLGQGRICPQKDAQALTAKRHGGGVGAEARRLAGVAAGVADFNSRLVGATVEDAFDIVFAGMAMSVLGVLRSRIPFFFMLNGGADWIRELAEHSSPSDGTRMSPIAWMGVTEKRGFRRSLSGSLDEWKSTQPRRLDISSGTFLRSGDTLRYGWVRLRSTATVWNRSSLVKVCCSHEVFQLPSNPTCISAPRASYRDTDVFDNFARRLEQQHIPGAAGPEVQYRDLTFSALETVDLLNQNIADTAGTVHYFQVIHGRLQITPNSGDIDQEEGLVVSEEASIEAHDAPSDRVWADDRHGRSCYAQST